jgi:hypothetical protein
VAAGTLLTTSFIDIDNPMLQWGLGLIMGGSTAGFIQVGTSLVRLASSKFSGGVANPVVSTAENFASIGFSIFTFWFSHRCLCFCDSVRSVAHSKVNK